MREGGNLWFIEVLTHLKMSFVKATWHPETFVGTFFFSSVKHFETHGGHLGCALVNVNWPHI